MYGIMCMELCVWNYGHEIMGMKLWGMELWAWNYGHGIMGMELWAWNCVHEAVQNLYK